MLTGVGPWLLLSVHQLLLFCSPAYSCRSRATVRFIVPQPTTPRSIPPPCGSLFHNPPHPARFLRLPPSSRKFQGYVLFRRAHSRRPMLMLLLRLPLLFNLSAPLKKTSSCRLWVSSPQQGTFTKISVSTTQNFLVSGFFNLPYLRAAVTPSLSRKPDFPAPTHNKLTWAKTGSHSCWSCKPSKIYQLWSQPIKVKDRRKVFRVKSRRCSRHSSTGFVPLIINCLPGGENIVTNFSLFPLSRREPYHHLSPTRRTLSNALL
ncbi:unnamed protein product [Arabis nemorensis]|uniref:Secreted protein n=1 Tax=Arabis nemorensis TaxID=586526 RepID=A0A565CC43_9BRAS|nr:unnamed protein product [Arabis nemorensis]